MDQEITSPLDDLGKVERNRGIVGTNSPSFDAQGRRVYWALAYDSTELDRHQTGMTPNAFSKSAGDLEFPILAFHNRESYPVGKPVDTSYDERGLSVGFIFADTEEAKTAEQLVAGGFLRGVSVGFIPTDGYKREEDGAVIFTEADLVELSLTPTPSSRKALIDLSRSLDNKDPDDLISEFGLQIEEEQVTRVVIDTDPVDRLQRANEALMEKLRAIEEEADDEAVCIFCDTEEAFCVCSTGDSRATSLTLPDFMRASLRRGLKLHEEGHSGSGLKPETVAAARKGAAGEPWSVDKHRRCAAWIARHIVDLDAYDGEKPTPGLVAMLLWGGGSTKKTAERAAAHCRAVVESHEKKSIDDAVQTLKDHGVSDDILRVIGNEEDQGRQISETPPNSQRERENRLRRSSRSRRHGGN